MAGRLSWYCFCIFIVFYHAKISQKKQKQKKNVDHILRCNVAKSWAKFGPNCQFSPIWNILVNLNVTFTCLLQLIMLVNTNINKVDHEIWSCINFGQFDQIIYLSHKEFFWDKWLLLFVDLLCSIMLLNTSKRLFE